MFVTSFFLVAAGQGLLERSEIDKSAISDERPSQAPLIFMKFHKSMFPKFYQTLPTAVKKNSDENAEKAENAENAENAEKAEKAESDESKKKSASFLQTSKASDLGPISGGNEVGSEIEALADNSKFTPEQLQEMSREVLDEAKSIVQKEEDASTSKSKMWKTGGTSCPQCLTGKDYNACPAAWTKTSSGSCRPPATYSGYCKKEQSFHYMTKVEKREFEANCGVCFPCITGDSSDCDPYVEPCSQ